VNLKYWWGESSLNLGLFINAFSLPVEEPERGWKKKVVFNHCISLKK